MVQAYRHLFYIGKKIETYIYKNDPRADAWNAYAKGIVNASQKLIVATEVKDKRTIFDQGGVLYQACSACHITFPAPEQTEE